MLRACTTTSPDEGGTEFAPFARSGAKPLRIGGAVPAFGGGVVDFAGIGIDDDRFLAGVAHSGDQFGEVAGWGAIDADGDHFRIVVEVGGAGG